MICSYASLGRNEVGHIPARVAGRVGGSFPLGEGWEGGLW